MKHKDIRLIHLFEISSLTQILEKQFVFSTQKFNFMRIRRNRWNSTQIFSIMKSEITKQSHHQKELRKERNFSNYCAYAQLMLNVKYLEFWNRKKELRNVRNLNKKKTAKSQTRDNPETKWDCSWSAGAETGRDYIRNYYTGQKWNMRIFSLCSALRIIFFRVLIREGGGGNPPSRMGGDVGSGPRETREK